MLSFHFINFVEPMRLCIRLHNHLFHGWVNEKKGDKTANYQHETKGPGVTIRVPGLMTRAHESGFAYTAFGKLIVVHDQLS